MTPAIYKQSNSSECSQNLQNSESAVERTAADQSAVGRDITQDKHASEQEGSHEPSESPPVPQTKVIPLMLGATITTTPFSTDEHPVHPEVVASSTTDNEMAKADTPPALRYLHRIIMLLFTLDPINLLLMHKVPGAKDICGKLALAAGLATTGCTIILMLCYALRLYLKGVRPSTLILFCCCLYLIPGIVCPAIYLSLRVQECGAFIMNALDKAEIVLLVLSAIAFLVGLIHLGWRLWKPTNYPTTQYTLVKKSFELLTIHMAYELDPSDTEASRALTNSEKKLMLRYLEYTCSDITKLFGDTTVRNSIVAISAVYNAFKAAGKDSSVFKLRGEELTREELINLVKDLRLNVKNVTLLEV